ncbi:MAG: phosphopantetheine-binding protein, partial [Waterburya sp.]
NTNFMDISHQSLYGYGMRSKASSISAFERILSVCNFSQVVISSGNLQTRIDDWIKLKSISTRELAKPKSLLSKHQRPNIGVVYIAPRNPIEKTIANIWQEVIGFEQIGIHENFFELGGHSLLAVQVTARLREAFSLDLPLRTLLFETPTIAKLAAIIASKITPATDTEEMEKLLTEIESLSPEELKKELAQKSTSN